MRTIFTFVQTILAPSDEGAVDCKLTVWQFTFYKSTEGGKNYKLDVLIGYYLINLYYINNLTNPNLLKCFQLRTIKIKKLIYLDLYYWQFYLILINSKSPQYNLDIGRKVATPSKGFADNLRLYYIYKKAKSFLLPLG